jgi:hypothetical protein
MADQISGGDATNGHDGKGNVETLEQTQPSPQRGGESGFANARAMSPEHRASVEKSLKRKLDARCSLFVLIYIMNYLDRNNIASAVCQPPTVQLVAHALTDCRL